jgi:hypothetical protein
MLAGRRNPAGRPPIAGPAKLGGSGVDPVDIDVPT